MPETLMDKFYRFRTATGYRFWKRKLKKYGYNNTSTFTILEIGCGKGFFLRCLKESFPKIELHGLDIDGDELKVASIHIEQAKFTTEDAHTLPYPNNFMDIVFAFHVAEHMGEPKHLISEVQRTLKPGGLFVFATPNPAGICAMILKKKWHPLCLDHVSMKPPGEWKQMIEENRLKILSDGTTGLTGFVVLHRLPFALINWIPMAIFGYFPWYKGESYMAIARKV